MRQLRRIARRFLGDDVDRAADGRRAVQRRTAAAQHLDPLDHVGRNLLQSVDARQGRKDRMRIDENLRIMAVESVDAHLREAAVLAVVLDPHAAGTKAPAPDTKRSFSRTARRPARSPAQALRAAAWPSGWPRRPLRPSKCRSASPRNSVRGSVPVRASPFSPARRTPAHGLRASARLRAGFSENSVPTRRSWCRMPCPSRRRSHREGVHGFHGPRRGRKDWRRCSSSASPRPTHRHTDT